MPVQIRILQKIARDPNFLVWRDTVYINLDGRPQYISFRLLTDLNDFLQGKVSEYVFETRRITVKLSALDIENIGRSLVTEYLFYEGTGTTLHDTSGNKNDCTIYGATWHTLANNKHDLVFDLQKYCRRGAPVNGDPGGSVPCCLVILFKPYQKLTTMHYEVDECGLCCIGNNALQGVTFRAALRISTRTLALDHGDGVWHTPNIHWEPDMWHLGFWMWTGKLPYVAGLVKNNQIIKENMVVYFGGAHVQNRLPNDIIVGCHVKIGRFFIGEIAAIWYFVNNVPTDNTLLTLYKLAKVMVPDLP